MIEPPAPSVPPLHSTSAASPRTPGLAIASLVLGIVSLAGAAVLIIPTILAIVFGHVSLSRIRKDPGLTGSGIAIAGFVLGYVSIIFGIVMAGLLAAMAIPAFQKVREASLQKTMTNDARQIASAAQQVMMETNAEQVSFAIDPETGAVTGALSPFITQVTKGTREVDGLIERTAGSFSLQHPNVRHGIEMVFDANGAPQ